MEGGPRCLSYDIWCKMRLVSSTVSGSLYTDSPGAKGICTGSTSGGRVLRRWLNRSFMVEERLSLGCRSVLRVLAASLASFFASERILDVVLHVVSGVLDLVLHVVSGVLDVVLRVVKRILDVVLRVVRANPLHSVCW